MTLRGAFIISLILCAVWLAMTPMGRQGLSGKGATLVSLRRMHWLLGKFREKHSATPIDFQDLRIFALRHNLEFLPYDGYAKRLIYRRLNRDFYYLASPSGHPKNILHLTNSPRFKPTAPVQKKFPLDLWQPFQAYYLEGARPPKGTYAAQLFRDPELGIKTLMVQKIGRAREIYLHNHPGIEEFVWVDQETILFSATGDGLYQDGLYYWKFKEGVEKNLLRPKLSHLSHTRKTSPPRYLISLGPKQKKKIYFFMTREASESLAPREFWSEKHLFYVDLEGMPKVKVASFKFTPPSLLVPHHPLLSAKEPHALSQKKWSQLPRSGPIGVILEDWQEFILDHHQSPILPYALFHLIVLYHDAYLALLPTEPKEAQALRAFGAELSGTLMSASACPSYLQRMAHHLYDDLLAQKPINLRVLHQPPPPQL